MSVPDDGAELVQQLRGRADWYDDAHPGTVKTPQALREAASTIERLQRELDEARADVRELCRAMIVHVGIHLTAKITKDAVHARSSRTTPEEPFDPNEARPDARGDHP